MDMPTDRPGPGHNHPNDALDPELIADQLSLSYAHHLRRRDELIAGIARFVIANGTLAKVATLADLAAGDRSGRLVFVEADNRIYRRLVPTRQGDPNWQPATDTATLTELIHTAVIRDAETEAKVISFVKQLKEVGKAIDLDRKREKAPYDSAGDAVQGFFAQGITERLTAAAKALEGVINVYARWKGEQERLRREEEAQRARDEANRLAAAAAATEHPDVIDTAIQSATEADRKERAAIAPASAMARGRGTMGGTSSLRQGWEIEVTDKMAVPVRYMLVDTAAIMRDVRAAKGAIEIPGIRITESSKTVVV